MVQMIPQWLAVTREPMNPEVSQSSMTDIPVSLQYILEPQRKGFLHGFHDALKFEIYTIVQTPQLCLCLTAKSIFYFFENEDLIA